jgi:hypothetical protein
VILDLAVDLPGHEGPSSATLQSRDTP